MHGLGNDFVVLDATQHNLQLSKAQAAFIADRHFGVGCDQILIVEQSESPEVDFRYRILNSDGGEVNQCGNGARCFVRFVHAKGLSDQNPITVETASGKLVLEAIKGTNQVVVNMGEPRFEPHIIPLVTDQQSAKYTLDLENQTIEFAAVSLGNPHAVLTVDDVQTAPVQALGAALESHAFFPERVNVGFMQVAARDRISLRVFERGVGETLACGSGACAAVVTGHQLGLLDRKVTVSLPGGDIQIEWSQDTNTVMMTGSAQTVFEGSIEIPTDLADKTS